MNIKKIFTHTIVSVLLAGSMCIFGQVFASSRDTSCDSDPNAQLIKQQEPEAVCFFSHSAKLRFPAFLNASWDGIDVTRTITALEKHGLTTFVNNVKEVKDSHLLTIEDIDILFVKQTKGFAVYIAWAHTPFQGKIKNSTKKTDAEVKDELKDLADFDAKIAHKWFDSSADYIMYNEVKGLGYMVKNSKHHWFYVPAKAPIAIITPLPPSPPSGIITSFYTSNDVEFSVVLANPTTVDLQKSKDLLQVAIGNGQIIGDNKKLAEDFIANATDADVEILEVEGKKLLFVKVNAHTTKVFHAEVSTHLQKNFGHKMPGMKSVQNDGIPNDIYFDLRVSPKWITDHKDVTYYKETQEGYSLLTKAGHWYYAKKATPFYTSKNNPFPVVLLNDTTVDLVASKKLLQDHLPLITNPDDRKLAEDFIANATDADVEILTVEDKVLLFVKSDPKTTKVFHKEPSTHLQENFGHKKGATAGVPSDVDFDNKISPKWITDHKDVTYYKATRDGYSLLTKEGHWYYAKKKVASSSGGGASIGGGSSSGGGGYSSSSSTTSATPTTFATPSTTEVKGDEVTRPKTAIFENFTKTCESKIKDLTDARLTAYYDALKVMNRSNINRALTRAEFLKLVLNSANVNVSNESAPSYSDVDKNHLLAKYISYATRTNMISGQNGKFRPNDIITRAEAAKIFVNAAALPLSGEVKTFADVGVKHSLAKYIQTAFDNCILHGRNTRGGETLEKNAKRIYEPNDAITLAETAKVLYNITQK